MLKKSLNAKAKEALVDLESTTVKSPIDGIIANRVVEPGVYMKKWMANDVSGTNQRGLGYC